jgi:anaerobic selenocysteine-containing dehydrogenase
MAVEIRRSVCALDCPDCCSLLINVENGTGSKLRGNPDHPVTRGFLCGKVARYLEREYDPRRILYPQKRIGAKGEGRFARISWNEALDTIAENLRRVCEQWGSEAVLPYSYAGTMGILNNASMDRRFFYRLGASRLDRTVCSSAGSAGLASGVGARMGTEPEQYRHSKLIIAWGANIHGRNVHLWPFVVEARRAGAKLYVIDPIRTRTAQLADRWYGIFPGSDLALALGLMHVIIREELFDRDYIERHTTGFEALRDRTANYTPERVAELTGIAAEDIVALAREYATIHPASIRMSYGIQRTDNGAAAVQAISLLPALTGSFREVGGGMQLSTTQAFQFDRAALERPDMQLRSPLRREGRALNMCELGSALDEKLEPPVKALVVYNSNPAAIAPDSNRVRRGLKRPDLFTVVMEQMQTDTADYADIVLPATTFLEHTDLYLSYGHYHVQFARPALPAPGETKPNVEVFRLLAQRMGFDDPEFSDTEDDLIRQTLGSGHPCLEGITLERLEREGSVRLNLPDPFLPFAEGAATPSGRFDLGAKELDYTPPVESRLGDRGLRSRFPLELVSSKEDDGLNSTFGNRPEVRDAATRLYMNTEDALPRGIANGDRVRVFNDRGSCLLSAVVDGVVRPGVVRSPSVGWHKYALNGDAVNVLTSERLTDRGGGPTFFSCLVQVEKCGD